ncbi:hypothetical protein ACIBHX_24780 [Nonomuraea sp. NPDC050536]|uniref:hypothetical protein n=1 Tax=Nonomuraea sp. NPDC050536 TaxID=3364366 RepID=UPI0037CBB012
MADRPLQTNAKHLARLSVGMDLVSERLTDLKRLIGQHGRLPSMALGVVGAPACARYNGRCDAADAAMDSLCRSAATIAETLRGTAVAYVSAESANLGVVASTGESGGVLAEGAVTGMFSATWLSRYGLHYAAQRNLAASRAAGRSVSAEVDTALEQATKVWAGDRDLELFQRWASPEEAVLAESRYNDFGRDMDRAVAATLEKQIAAEDEISRLAMLSQRTDEILRMTRSFNIAATAASILWTANAVIMSDDLIDNAIGIWYGMAAATRTIFQEWMPAIREALFPDWVGDASTAAQKRFAAFVDDGMAFANRAEHIASSLHTVIRRLDQVYWAAFAFSLAQFGAMAAFAAVAWFNPGAAAVLRYLGMMLRVSVTVAINAIIAVLGGLLAWAEA